MANYKLMYYKVIRAQNKAIKILQNAHMETERIFIDAKEPIALLEKIDKQKTNKSRKVRNKKRDI